jgi:hypothetical protein
MVIYKISMYRRETLLYGLIFECPLKKELDDCPLKEIRTLPIRERITFIKKLSDTEKRKILNSHEICIEKRQASLKNKTKLLIVQKN